MANQLGNMDGGGGEPGSVFRLVGAWIRSTGWGIVACVVAILGLARDLLAESLFIGWLPARIETLAPFGSLLTGGAANGLYTIAGVILTLGTPSLHGVSRIWAWAIWTSGIALTVCTVIGSVTGMVISTTALMLLHARGLPCSVGNYSMSVTR
jgi:hypothetical protein